MSARRPARRLEPVSKTRLRLWLRLLKTTRSVETELRERLRTEYASTLPRFDVMAALERHPDGLKMSELSKVLRVSNGNVTGIVERLVDDGIALRESVPGDRRAVLIRLTAKGRDEFDRLANAHENWIDALLGDLDPGQVTELTELLERIPRDPTEEPRS